jgi:hypothetical protein
MANAPQSKKISRDDLEQQFAGLQRTLQGKVEDRKQTLMTIGTVVAVIVVIAVFFFGKNAGKKSSTFLEIRRL